MKKIFKITIPIIVIVLTSLAIYFIFFHKSNDLVGLWDIDGNTKYEFIDNKKGKLIVPNSEYPFTYKIKDNVISIDFENENSIDSDFEYKLNKDILELTNVKDNRNHTLKRVKE